MTQTTRTCRSDRVTGCTANLGRSDRLSYIRSARSRVIYASHCIRSQSGNPVH